MEILRLKQFLIIVTTLFIAGCANSDTITIEDAVYVDTLKHNIEFEKQRELNAAISYNTTDYYVYQGITRGFHYELLQRFSKEIGVSVKLHVIDTSLTSLYDTNNSKKCNIIAMNISSRNTKLKDLTFSEPLFNTDLVLVTNDKIKGNLLDYLSGKFVYVRKDHFAVEQLKALRADYGIWFTIIEVMGVSCEEELIYAVNNGEIAITATYAHIENALAHSMHNINITTLTPNVPICWGFPVDSDSTVLEFNQFIKTFKQSGEFAYLYKRYFENEKFNSQYKSRYHQLKNGEISQFDNLFKHESKRLSWDWKWLAAIAYNESKFQDTIESAQGAYGLMQIIPETAEHFGVQDYIRPDSNVYVGVMYLKYLDNLFKDSIPDVNERINFVLSSYNAGAGHIFDAMRLAKANQYSPYKWENSVEQFLLIKSDEPYRSSTLVKNGICKGLESVEFVKRVRSTFDSYMHHVL